MEQRDELILQKIIMFCERIAANLKECQTLEKFQDKVLYQDACAMCLVQIGELVTLLSDEVKSKMEKVPWRIIKDTRNFYVHNYGSVDVKTFWKTLNEDISSLCSECEKILGKN